MQRKAQLEAERAQLEYAAELREALKAAALLETAKAANPLIPGALPSHLWPEWQKVKERLRDLDAKYEKFYK